MGCWCEWCNRVLHKCSWSGASVFKLTWISCNVLVWLQSYINIFCTEIPDLLPAAKAKWENSSITLEGDRAFKYFASFFLIIAHLQLWRIGLRLLKLICISWLGFLCHLLAGFQVFFFIFSYPIQRLCWFYALSWCWWDIRYLCFLL